MKGWKGTGINPFTICVMHDLKAEEEHRARLSKSANMINYERLSLTFQDSTHERNEKEQDAELLNGPW